MAGKWLHRITRTMIHRLLRSQTRRRRGRRSAKNKGGRPAAEAWAIAAAEAIDIGIEIDPQSVTEFVRMIMERIDDNGPPGEVQITRCVGYLFKRRADSDRLKKRA